MLGTVTAYRVEKFCVDYIIIKNIPIPIAIPIYILTKNKVQVNFRSKVNIKHNLNLKRNLYIPKKYDLKIGLDQ